MTRLKFERIKRGWSQTTLAYLAKLPQPVICLIETGRQNPTADELEALGQVFGIAPPSVLLKEVTVVDPNEVEVSPVAEAKNSNTLCVAETDSGAFDTIPAPPEPATTNKETNE